MTTPDEPDNEPPVDPEDLEPREFDPDSMGPKAPEIPDYSEKAADADPEVSALFWKLVLVFNVAVMGVSLGLMFGVFRNNWELGSQLLAGGLILGGYGFYRYRRFQRS